ncbi:MAG: hypothetical protein JO191_12580 [Mycobacteriaceae bacterium]|nr:hypothetical protein [Mycobacteriaceae bacterium]
MAIQSCPACGYPKFGPGLCAYCVPAVAADGAVDPAPWATLTRRDPIGPLDEAAAG